MPMETNVSRQQWSSAGWIRGCRLWKWVAVSKGNAHGILRAKLNESGRNLRVFLLAQEGYSGYGFDLRARKSWALWGPSTPLKVSTLSPVDLCLSDRSPFPEGAFLIGNHADELTPWMPLLATLTPNSSFLNIPCCFHTFTSRFMANKYSLPKDILDMSELKNDIEIFESKASEKGGRYNAYLRYIAEIHIRSGWKLEREALRIPSTKNWAFVGRNRLYSAGLDDAKQEEVKDWVKSIATQAQSTWVARKPEGKDH